MKFAASTKSNTTVPYHISSLATFGQCDEQAAVLQNKVAELEEEKATLRSQVHELAERNHELEVTVVKLQKKPEHAVADLQKDVDKLLYQVSQRVAESRRQMGAEWEGEVKNEEDIEGDVDDIKEESIENDGLNAKDEQHRKRKRVKLERVSY